MKPIVAVLLLLATPAVYPQEQHAQLHVKPGRVVTVTGKWKATTGRPGDELAFKHVVEIDCFKSSNTCTEAQANIVGTEPDIGVQYYEIIHWDENGLIAKSDDAECMTNELHINFQDQNVMAIDSPKRGAVGLQGSCKSPALSHTQTYKLVAR